MQQGTDMDYFVVMQDFGKSGLEAVVDPALIRSDIIRRIKTREYDNIVRIDHVQHTAVSDVTAELIDEAEAELEEAAAYDYRPARVQQAPWYMRHG
jgi:hypothetical protein